MDKKQKNQSRFELQFQLRWPLYKSYDSTITAVPYGGHTQAERFSWLCAPQNQTAVPEQRLTRIINHSFWLDSKAAVERENVSRKSRKPVQLKAFSFTDYQLITKLISIIDNNIQITSLLDAVLPVDLHQNATHGPAQLIFLVVDQIINEIHLCEICANCCG